MIITDYFSFSPFVSILHSYLVSDQMTDMKSNQLTRHKGFAVRFSLHATGFVNQAYLDQEELACMAEPEV